MYLITQHISPTELVKVATIQPFPWEDDINLKPIIEDDPLLQYGMCVCVNSMLYMAVYYICVCVCIVCVYCVNVCTCVCVCGVCLSACVCAHVCVIIHTIWQRVELSVNTCFLLQILKTCHQKVMLLHLLLS